MIRVEIFHKPTIMWNLTLAQKVIIYKNGNPAKKLYIKKDRTKLNKAIEKLND